MTAAWPREQYVVGGGTARIVLIALASVRLPDPLPISRRRHGMPDDSAGAAHVELVVRDRATDPAAFLLHVIEPFTELLTTDLGEDIAARVAASEHAYIIECEVDDPDDLGHLQAAWALAKCICEEGAQVVIDVYGARAHLAHDVAALDPARSFDVMHDVTLFFDEQPDGTLAAWSLGLVKFGRPDLVTLGIDPDAAPATAVMLRDVAATLADGERVEPGDTIGVATGLQIIASRFDPAAAPGVAIEGDALLLQVVTATAAAAAAMAMDR